MTTLQVWGRPLAKFFLYTVRYVLGVGTRHRRPVSTTARIRLQDVVFRRRRRGIVGPPSEAKTHNVVSRQILQKLG